VKRILIVSMTLVSFAFGAPTLAQFPPDGCDRTYYPVAEAQPKIRAIIDNLRGAYRSRMSETALNDALQFAEVVLNDGATLVQVKQKLTEEAAHGRTNKDMETEVSDADNRLVRDTNTLATILTRGASAEVTAEFIRDVHDEAIKAGLVKPVAAGQGATGGQNGPVPLSSLNLSDYKGLSAHADSLPASKAAAKYRFYRLAMQAAIKATNNGSTASGRAQAKAFLKTLAGRFTAIRNKLPDDGSRDICGMDIQICLSL
jgi:hypothetical protein